MKGAAMTLQDATPVTTADGLRLRGFGWPGAPAQAATVLIVHGLGEHAGRYATLGTELQQAGWNVVAYDQRGHGRSEGARGRIAQDDSLLCDLSRVIDRVRADFPAPLVLLGHSLGGGLCARFVAEALAAQPASWSRPVDALVLSSPALALHMNAAQKALLALTGRWLPDLVVGNGIAPAGISRDPAVVAAYVADPLVHNRVSPRLVNAMRDAGRVAQAEASRWRTPTLLLWAGSDRLVDPAGAAAFAQAAPRQVVDAQEFPALFHEIFNEPEREEVAQRLVEWLSRIRPVAASSPG